MLPNLWTHIMFCEEVVDSLNNPILIQDAQSYLNLGAQGPDPFFYHNFWPWKKDNRVNKIGSLIHTKHCGPFLLDLIFHGTSKSTETKAYIIGFVTHHILDRNAHPYIHYRAGYEGNNHSRFEIIIDTLLMKKFRNISTWKVPVYKELNVGPTLSEEITEILEGLIEKYFPEETKNLPPNYVQAAYRDMKKALRILYDPKGWKNKLLSSMISAYSHQPIKDKKDYLNEERRVWNHPATNEPHTESFLQLYEQGRNEGMETVSAIMQFWKEPTTEHEENVKRLIGDISYDTGKPLSENLENRYCDPII
jgi:Zinc dependent phospholipase C